MSEATCRAVRNKTCLVPPSMLAAGNRVYHQREGLREPHASLLMTPPILPRLMFRISIHQRADHALIRHAPLLRSALEELDAAARQPERHLHIVLPRHQGIR